MGCGPSAPADGSYSGDAGSPPRGKDARSSVKKGNKQIETLFATNGEEKSLAGDDVLIEQNSSSDSAFYIKTGKVKLMLTGENGETKQLATRSTGDVLGELSLLLGQPATVTAVADGPVQVIEVSQARLMGQLREDPARGHVRAEALHLSLWLGHVRARCV